MRKVKRSGMFTKRSSHKSCGPPLQPVCTEATGRVGIGPETILVYRLYGVMKFNNMYIGHNRSVEVCSSKITCIALHRVSNASCSLLPRLVVGRPRLVL